MCGIVGILQLDGLPLQEADRRTLDRQLSSLSNRGPDASGNYHRGPVALGHRRLAIRDPEQGPQPWVSPNEECVIVYNGEIYNDAELRTELSSSFVFRTKCDTEVVLAAYLKWGRQCVSRLNGMFALGIYDFRSSELWLARDRFGIKPLYYAKINDRFVFASQPAAILLHPGYSKEPNWSVISHYLSTTRLTLGSQSLYQGIELLQPAEEMVVAGRDLSIRRYWDYPTQRHDMDYADAVDLLESKLTTSIRKRLVSDVPLGLFLSGGVDSCTITALLHGIEPRSRYAACAVAADHTNGPVPPELDEFAYAQECAQQFAAELEPVQIDGPTYLDRWRTLVQEFRLPLATPSDVMIYELAKAAKNRVGVVLGGEGADELLCGYEVASWSGHDFDATRGKGPLSSELLASITRQYGRSVFRDEADHYFAIHSLVPSWAKVKMLSGEIWDSIDEDHEMFAHYQSVFDSCGSLSTVEKYSIVLHRINLESLLSRLDVTTMHAGLEARVPFTDHNLVESVLQLPLEYQIDRRPGNLEARLASAELAAAGGIRSKRMLRDVAQRFLPAKIAQRRKASFPTGVQNWLHTEWRSSIAEYLKTSPFARFMFTEPFLADLAESPERAGMWMWPIANLSFWGDSEFFDTRYSPQVPLRVGRTLVA